MNKRGFYFFLSFFLFIFIFLNQFLFFKSKIKETYEKKYIKSCLNKIVANESIALFTQLHDNENYSVSAIKLLKSAVKFSNYKFDKIILESKDKLIRYPIKKLLLQAGWKTCIMERIPPRDEHKTFPRFRETFNRLLLWNMTEYKQIIFMDADVFVAGNIDFLLNLKNEMIKKNYILAATKDISNGKILDTFNAGVHVLLPNKLIFKKLISLKADSNFIFHTTMADQGFLNKVFKNQWFDFGFFYNAKLAYYSQKRQFWDENEKDIKVIHFTMKKPWACTKIYEDICKKWTNFRI